jgi:hypothetical protein
MAHGELVLRVVEHPRQYVESNVPENPQCEDELKALKFLAIFARHICRKGVALPKRGAMHEVVD